MALALVKEEYKNCGWKTCEQVNPQLISNFTKNKASSDGLQYYCKICSAKKIKDHQLKNPEKWSSYARKYRVKNYDKHRSSAKRYQEKYPDRMKNTVLKRVFGITLEKYNEMYSAQKGCCKICKLHSTEFKKNLAVDHCHKTNSIRGLLCHHCNTAIGLLKEDPLIFEEAIRYLKDLK